MSWRPPCALIWAGSQRRVGIGWGPVWDAGAAGGPRHRVAAGEATGIENGNRRSETAAYEPLGSGFRDSVRAEGADAAGTGGCDGEGGR